MPNTDKHAALAEFAQSGDEDAVAEIVSEFGGLVFVSAQRRVDVRILGS